MSTHTVIAFEEDGTKHTLKPEWAGWIDGFDEMVELLKQYF